MAEYQGHRSWNSWNVSLWVNNTESLYFYARDLVKEKGRRRAARQLSRELEGEKTPDGANYNFTCLYEALEGIEE